MTIVYPTNTTTLTKPIEATVAELLAPLHGGTAAAWRAGQIGGFKMQLRGSAELAFDPATGQFSVTVSRRAPQPEAKPVEVAQTRATPPTRDAVYRPAQDHVTVTPVQAGLMQGIRPTSQDPIDPTLDAMRRRSVLALDPKKVGEYERATGELERHLIWFHLYEPTMMTSRQEKLASNPKGTKNSIATRISAVLKSEVPDDPVERVFKYAQALQADLPTKSSEVWPGTAAWGVMPGAVLARDFTSFWVRLPEATQKNWNNMPLLDRCTALQQAILKLVDDAVTSKSDWGRSEDQVQALLGVRYGGWDPKSSTTSGRPVANDFREKHTSELLDIPMKAVKGADRDAELMLTYAAVLLNQLLLGDWAAELPPR